MTETPVQRALTASSIALLVAVACLALFLPPMVQRTVSSVPLVIFVGMTLAVALILHWVFAGIAAARAGRSVMGWVALALLFPIGGVAVLLLLAWFADEARLNTLRT